MQKRVLWGIALLCCNLFPQYIYESNQSLIDLTNQTNVTWLTSGDDSISSAFNLGFDFTFYEQTFSTARMATNGCLHFGSSGTGCNDYTPDPLAQFNYTIYPFWTDLIAVDANAKMAAKNFNDKIVFGWYKMQEYYRQGSYNSFEVILWNNNTYDIRYGDLDIINHDVLIGEQGSSSQTYTYYFHDECNTGSTNGTNCFSYDWNASDKNTNLEAGGSLYGEGDGLNCSDPLNDSSCDGYEEAYLAQQCNLDALYSTSCSGYDQAYQDQQCSIDALYSTECSGYEQAYRDYECEQDSQYSPTCSGYIPEVIAIMAVQTSSTEYETYQITEEEVIPYNEPITEEQFEQFYFEDPVEQDIYIDPIIDAIESYDSVTEVTPINIFDAEELLEVFTTTEIIEEIEEFIEEEPIEEFIEEIIEEEIIEELIAEEVPEEIIEEELIEEVIETFEETPKGNSIANALKVVAQTIKTATDSYTKQNNIGNNENNPTGGISTTSSPSISDQILSANIQTNTVLELNDSANSLGDNAITITPLFSLDDTMLSDVQISNIQDEIMSATNSVMTASEADKIADQILANNLKEAQEDIEDEQEETGEYADQTTLIAYLGYVPAFNAYRQVEMQDRDTWYESKDIYKNAIIFDNTTAYNAMAGNNVSKLQTMINLQVNL
jgi:hypothetical protein